MVESGSFPNAESDDALTVTPAAPEADDDVVAAASDGTQPHVEPSEEVGLEPTAAGGFGKVQTAALSAVRLCLDGAGVAASRGAGLVAAYPRAALATGLSTVVLGGVLTFSPGKKPPVAQVPNSEAPAAPGVKNEADAPGRPPKPTSAPPEPPLLAQTGAEGETGPGAAAGPADEPVLNAEPHSASLLPVSAGPEPTPPAPAEPVKLTAGTVDPGLPELPVVEHEPAEPPVDDAATTPVPAPAIAAGALGGLEIARADVTPGEPAIGDVPEPSPAAAPEPTAVPEPAAIPEPATAAAVTPAADPLEIPEPTAPPAPATPSEVVEIPEPAKAPDASPTPEPAGAPAMDAGAALQPATVPEPAAPFGPLESSAPTPTPAVEPGLPLAAPAPPAGVDSAAGGALGSLGLGAGLGATAAAAAGGPEARPAEPAPTTSPAASNETGSDHDEVPIGAPRDRTPEPTPPSGTVPEIETPAPAPAPSSNPIPIQAQAPSSPPGSLPAFQEVPEPALGSTAEPATAVPAAEPDVDAAPKPGATATHPDWKPLRRSGDLVAGGFDRDEPRADDRFTRGDEEPGDANRFDLETFSAPSLAPGQAAERAAAASSTSAATVHPAGKIDTVLHKVETGENFYTIAQSYYSSGRYYRALAYANSDKFKRPEDLFVGAVIRVPPPEELNPSFIDPPGTRYRSKARSASNSTASRPPQTAAAKTGTPIRRAGRSQIELNLPSSDPASGTEFDPDRDRYEPEAASRRVSTRPVHKVQPYETLRTIARDRLGSARRAGEILELNRDAVDDPSDLIVGQVLELPDDAQVARYQGSR